MTHYAYAIGGRSDHCGYPLPGETTYRYRLDRGGEALTNLQMAAAIDEIRWTRTVEEAIEGAEKLIEYLNLESENDDERTGDKTRGGNRGPATEIPSTNRGEVRHRQGFLEGFG